MRYRRAHVDRRALFASSGAHLTPDEAYEAYIAKWSPPTKFQVAFCERAWTPLTRSKFIGECVSWLVLGYIAQDFLNKVLTDEGRVTALR